MKKRYLISKWDWLISGWSMYYIHSNMSEDQNTILRVKITGDDNLDVHLGIPTYDWRPEIIDRFLHTLSDKHQMKADFLERIAKNDDWYKEIKKYRNEN